MKPHILVVEDSVVDQKLILAALGTANSLRIAGTIEDARKELRNATFNLILLDVELPDGDGFRFFSVLQSDPATKQIPVIFLTMKGETPDEVMAFALGAEDFIPKPVDPLKLDARVAARLRKLHDRKQEKNILQNSGLKLDFEIQRGFRLSSSGEKEMDFTPLEFKLLSHFMRHEDQVFSRNQLMDHCWGKDMHVIDRSVDMHVSNLRRKIAGSGFTIEALRSVGYRFSRITQKKSK